MRLGLPANLFVWDCGVFTRTRSKGRGGLERELPGGAIYINALEIVPLSHYHGRLLSVTSQGGFLVFLCRCMSLYRAPPLCGSL